MHRLFFRSSLLVALVALSAVAFGCTPGEPAGDDAVPVARPTTESSSAPPPARPARAGRPAKTARASSVDNARARMGAGARDGHCGPYRLLTDVTDRSLLAACEVIGTTLDATYSERFGVPPVGEPRGTIFLFARAAGYRAFLADEGAALAGYAGVTRPTRGYTSLTADGLAPERVVATLAHELTHLVHRRALGSDLPRWLSEGLADAIGDAATLRGPGPLTGLAGMEEPARRLAWGYRQGQVGTAQRLVALGRDRFDQDPVTFDYEQAALLVRILLLDPALAPRLRAYLSRLAAAERYDPEALRSTLGVAWDELDGRLRAALRSPPP